ncbi:hypothetical protein K2173_014015 [Erythroxylum novogranatense]|uniref:Uncharacterized protein n=1 Tax=Erythroxylum novogranatense TaxID=1862640 RepID=A0AAV8SD36_9ROSI|nr:hypothetical protein K2173_014015 [Erythroxylum novogranatense]
MPLSIALFAASSFEMTTQKEENLLFGSLLSLYGCYLYQIVGRRKFVECHIESNSEQGYYIPLNYGEGYTNSEQKFYENKVANVCCHLFQIIFQMISGVVTFTDCVYWSIIFPYFTIKDYPLNFPFPWFRISYFILWTGVYVLFQWIFHAFVPIWWPYPFLDLSSPYAPLWYLLMALLHLPCYGIFLLIVKLKHHMLSKWFPLYYHSST